jgi:hypothetical protein
MCGVSPDNARERRKNQKTRKSLPRNSDLADYQQLIKFTHPRKSVGRAPKQWSE